ncbi:hypothetical protein [Kribbella sp. NPDC051137]|uniref:hypothetical protein n=1 Tax=Kribbella sp. NPDC051137 TaxID=3155045 RepID=UPI00341CEE81
MTDPVHAVLVAGSGLVLAATAVLNHATDAATDAAGTLTRPQQVAVLLVAALVLGGLYLLACAIWPYANCARCNGQGKSRSPSGKKFRNCPRCKGTGRRKRIGRRLLDHRATNR